MIKVLEFRHGQTPYISRKDEKELEALNVSNSKYLGADNKWYELRMLFPDEGVDAPDFVYLCAENDTYFVADFPFTLSETEKLFPHWFKNGGV